MAESSPALKTSNDSLPLKAALFTIVLCCLFGANATAIKVSFTGTGVFTTVSLRFLLASLVLLLWAALKKIPLPITRRQTLQLATISLIFFLQMSCFYNGQSLTTASHGTLVANLLPFVVMVLAHFFLENDRITKRKIVGLLFGFGGISLLLFDTSQIGHGSLVGDAMIFCAVILWGVNVVIIKRIIADYNPLQITLYPMLMSTPLFLITAWFQDHPMITSLSPAVIGGLLFQAFTASFGFIMWNTLIRKFGATALHSFIFILPLSGVFFGVTLLGEPVTSNLIGAIILVSTGLIVVNFSPQKKKYT